MVVNYAARGRLKNVGNSNEGMIFLVVKDIFVVQFFYVVGNDNTGGRTLATGGGCHHAAIGLTKRQFPVLVIVIVHIECGEIMLFQEACQRHRRIFSAMHRVVLQHKRYAQELVKFHEGDQVDTQQQEGEQPFHAAARYENLGLGTT